MTNAPTPSEPLDGVSLPTEWMTSVQWANRLPRTGGCAMSAKTVLAVQSALDALRAERDEWKQIAEHNLSRRLRALGERNAAQAALKARPLAVERAMELADRIADAAVREHRWHHSCMGQRDAAREALRAYLMKDHQ